MRCEGAGSARGGRVGRGGQLVDHRGDGLGADAAGPQQHRTVAGQARQIDDGRLDANLAGAAVEHHGEGTAGFALSAKFVTYVLGSGRTDVAELVGRRRRDAAAAALECLQQRNRHRVRRAAQADRVLPARDGGGNVGGASEDHRQRAGPERRGQLARLGGDVTGPVVEYGAGRQMDDHRMVLRAPLGGVNRGDRGRILGVGPQPVHGFGRKANQRALFEGARGGGDLLICPRRVARLNHIHGNSRQLTARCSKSRRRRATAPALRPASARRT